jgi:hypothetical protein
VSGTRPESRSDPRWRAASLIVVGGLATWVLWLAWQYYFSGGPRYRLESAVIALVIVGATFVALRRGEVPDSRTPDTPVSRAWLPIFIVAAVALYQRAIGLGLLSDDYALRAMAQSANLGSGTGWFFRPVPLLLWRGLLAIVDSGTVLHVLNIVLHGINAFLVARLGAAMGMRRNVALGAAALFLTFPALPEAVVWAAGVQDVLMTTMALGAVVLCARETPGAWRIGVVCGLLILGFGSKETAVCIPVLIAVCWLTRERVRRDVRLFGALALVTAVYLAIRLPMGIAGDYLAAPTRYFFKQMVVIAFGTLATPWRAPLSLVEHWQSFAAVGLTMLLLVHAFMTWRGSERRTQRDVRLALWVLASIAPVFTLFFVGPTLEGSRYLYLASCAWSLVLADLIASVTERVSTRVVFGGVVAAIALVFTVSVQQEIGIWQQAAALRDRVLANARAVSATAGCVKATFDAIPDSVAGAYVFRNGFLEAIGSAASNPTDVPPNCRFTWTGSSFASSR